MNHNPAITAVLPAFRRKQELLLTLRKLAECDPAPAEIIVHLDHGAQITLSEIRQCQPSVRVITSDTPVGPGGARNKLIAASRNEFIASFDDDSYPVDRDYFARIEKVFAAFPGAAVIAAKVFTLGVPKPPAKSEFAWVTCFAGCGCAYRRSIFLETPGYVPLPIAYGLEEIDIAMNLFVAGRRILRADNLRVFHNTDYSGHRNPLLVTGTIANAGLLVYLRYPVALWPRGIVQYANTIAYALRQKRFSGILSGVLQTPFHIYRYRDYRRTLPAEQLRIYLKHRGLPIRVDPSNAKQNLDG